MQTLPISKAKDRLNELVDEAATTHEHVTITKNGVPALIQLARRARHSRQRRARAGVGSFGHGSCGDGSVGLAPETAR
jgi:antitoxin (DNA-binding transcriptional repressor) of toxin-antitoxin stability system